MQYIGSIGSVDGESNAMLCMDSDRPAEVMIHRYGGTQPPYALLTDCAKSGDTWTLTPRWIYRERDGGGLYLPNLSELSDDVRQFMHEARAILHETADELTGSWTGPNGTSGTLTFKVPRTELAVAAHDCESWDEFKVWAGSIRQKAGGYWFRGHGDRGFRLRTTLHRAGRTRLERYCDNELPNFKNHAEAVLGLRLSLNDGEDFSTALGLAQHHGLPTPMLDWTASPYVAAFFAFSDALEAELARPHATHVRVFALTEEFVRYASPNVVTLPKANPYVACLSVAPRNNPRLYAQRGQFVVTNVSDLETYLLGMERFSKVRFLYAADIPIRYAREALQDLEFMGLSAAALFPGLDGVCRMMKHQMTFNAPPPVAAVREVSTSAGPHAPPKRARRGGTRK